MIAQSVDEVIRHHYPTRFYSLCHVYAILGSNLISIIGRENFRPVAGLAAIDCGQGSIMRMADNSAFARPEGGAYHCWIESVDGPAAERQLVDLTFRHNHIYAEQNGHPWHRAAPPDFLWALKRDAVFECALAELPANFPDGQMWLAETEEGAAWLQRQLAEHQNALVVLTAEALSRCSAELLKSECTFNEI
ncbi:MAG: hypothetical protein JO171_01670 [Paludibacterium sp.]|uniref:hypothetical protein n=1 Tax=Paludibacterium sp. TaxID=1917523 RepID=UPI0025DD9139|nr:hypothetical protein [Paludibacterium sp.]MBV8045834.1 hypothetical protein [Paludibacterium sp.]